MAGNNIMGRTVKISELKKFDVFLWNELVAEKFIYVGCRIFVEFDNEYTNYSFYNEDLDKEVELLGRMELIGEHTEFDLDERTRLRKSLKELKEENAP